MPAADIAFIRNVSQTELFVIMVQNVKKRLLYDISVRLRVADPGLRTPALFLRAAVIFPGILPAFRPVFDKGLVQIPVFFVLHIPQIIDDLAAHVAAAAKVVRHGPDGFFQLVHAGRLQKKTRYAQLDGALGVLKIPVTRQKTDLHPGMLGLNGGYHGQPVHIVHGNVRDQNVRGESLHDFQPLQPVLGGCDHLAVEIGPADAFFQSLTDNGFVVDDQNFIHGIYPFTAPTVIPLMIYLFRIR